MTVLGDLKEKAEQLRKEAYVIYLAFRDSRTPWYAKALLLLITAYLLSPVDLIPDFIPVLGYLDDIVIVPAGVYLAFKMIPREVREECRQRARTEKFNSRIKWIATGVILLVWLLVIYLIVKIIWL